MRCPSCEAVIRNIFWKCPQCGGELQGGVLFVTGISGSEASDYVQKVVAEAANHKHLVTHHDIGTLMRKHAQKSYPELKWERILDASDSVLRLLRALAFQDVAHDLERRPDHLHIVDLHLSFRWKVYPTKGFEPQILEEFKPYVRAFVNIIEDIPKVQARLASTAWGPRPVLGLLLWREEELFLNGIFADSSGPVESIAIAAGEPPKELERIIWHPETKRVYLSFPITHIKEDEKALQEIAAFRDQIREFLIVFDPWACKDYDETYHHKEMEAVRAQVGDATVVRDFRFIDQADAVVVYYPKLVPSKGVDAEMKHAFGTGKPIYQYAPEKPGGGPFAVEPNRFSSNQAEYISILRRDLANEQGGENK